MKKGPIILIEDDKDDQELMQDILHQVHISNELICFTNGREALQYLKTTSDQPFLILSDVNMPLMNGLELGALINEDEELKNKSIPFIFLTTTASTSAVKQAYNMSVQGFFEKGANIKEIGKMIRLIYDYWQLCRHPNN